jgi:protein OS-9
MHLYLLPPSLLALCGLVQAAGPHWSLAEDPYAFPKFRISFLNGLPVLNETAERWLAGGLKGGEREFLNQPWQNVHSGGRVDSFQSIDSGNSDPETDSVRRTSFDGTLNRPMSLNVLAYCYRPKCSRITATMILQTTNHLDTRCKG